MRPGERWFVIGAREDSFGDDLYVSNCGGSMPIGADGAPAWAGEGHPPDAGIAAPPERSPRDLPAGDLDVPRLLVLGVAAVGGLVAAALVLGRRQRAPG